MGMDRRKFLKLAASAPVVCAATASGIGTAPPTTAREAFVRWEHLGYSNGVPVSSAKVNGWFDEFDSITTSLGGWRA